MTHQTSTKVFKGQFNSLEESIMADFNFGLGYLKLEKPDVPNALSHLNAALSKSAGSDKYYPEIFAAKGEAFKIIDEYEQAIAYFDSAIGTFPDGIKKAFCFFSKAQCLKQVGRYDEALEAIESALSLKPGMGIFDKEKSSILSIQGSEADTASESSYDSSGSSSPRGSKLIRKLSFKNLLKPFVKRKKSDSSDSEYSDDQFGLMAIDEEDANTVPMEDVVSTLPTDDVFLQSDFMVGALGANAGFL